MSNINFRKLIRGELQPKLTRKKWILFALCISLSCVCIYFLSHKEATGLFPVSFLNKPQHILPPEPNTANQTFDKVVAFIKSDNTDTIPYGEGFNCVDSVFRVWRNAEWQGIKAVPIAIQYEESPGHMVIGFPTIDRGDVFFETENDQQIRLAAGQNYGGRNVRGFYYMDVTWVPLANSPEYDPSIVIK